MILAKTGLIKILAVLFAIIAGSTLGVICYFALNLGGFTRPPLEVIHDVPEPSMGFLAVVFLVALIAWIRRDSRKVKALMDKGGSDLEDGTHHELNDEDVDLLLEEYNELEAKILSIDKDISNALFEVKSSAIGKLKVARSKSEVGGIMEGAYKSLRGLRILKHEMDQLENKRCKIISELLHKGYNFQRTLDVCIEMGLDFYMYDVKDYAEIALRDLDSRNLEDIGEFCRQQMAKSKDTV